ncbi:MAG: UDP-2,4-diacetamido-2,4,6-trideoxy-beta-L-altropyranose hydrolase, partial [Planctomycetales bacterium]|nr:UDP-2,4-diacetamido-2,4,6-trideoxy-beta-L-altropyranose hydrolase [Planctomycetales bacterium]
SGSRDLDPEDESNLTAHAKWLQVPPSQDALQTAEALGPIGAIDWLVVDHYGIDARWEQMLRPFVGSILVIDDLADRQHECDMLLDQNYYLDANSRYDGLVPPHCRQLIGPGYVILRPEFKHLIDTRLRDRSSVRRLLVNFGGVDPDNVTGLAVEAVLELQRPMLAVNVVIGASNPNRTALEQQLERLPSGVLHVQTTKMAALIATADLALGACGASTWERCYLGLPSLVVVVADNQRQAAADLHCNGIIENLGNARDLTVSVVSTALRELIDAPTRRAAMSRRSIEILSATGGDIVKLME